MRDTGQPAPAYDVVHVVVPARDEERLLPRCLDGLHRAVDAVRSVHATLEVRVSVVLDSCTDRSAEVVLAHPGVEAVSTLAGSVGAARAAGVERARHQAAGVAPGRVWIATTDADSLVGPTWLLDHLTAAHEGVVLLCGAVRPDPADTAPELRDRWDRWHLLTDGHEHVFGANLGFSLAAYDLAGGFPPVRSGEDVALVTRLRAAGVVSRASGTRPVMTSGRRRGRAPEGFATYLDELGAELPA